VHGLQFVGDSLVEQIDTFLSFHVTLLSLGLSAKEQHSMRSPAEKTGTKTWTGSSTSKFRQR
jgi:hypothetical protein